MFSCDVLIESSPGREVGVSGNVTPGRCALGAQGTSWQIPPDSTDWGLLAGREAQGLGDRVYIHVSCQRLQMGSAPNLPCECLNPTWDFNPE